jgi:hypothetical protein
MSNDVLTGSTATPPPVALVHMMTGYWVSQAIYVAAKLGIADLLAHAPLSAEQLAAATDTDASSLYRVLRALAASLSSSSVGGRFRPTAKRWWSNWSCRPVKSHSLVSGWTCT